MIKGGKGGGLTKSGLRFESRTDLKTLFSRFDGNRINGNDLTFNDRLVAQLYKKHEFYKNFLSKLKVDWKTKISKKLIPDDSIFVVSKKLFAGNRPFFPINGMAWIANDRKAKK